MSNTTAEMLAWCILDSLLPQPEARGALGNLATLQVAVEEADQQRGICRRLLSSGVIADART